MRDLKFEWIQGNLYLATKENNNLTYVYKAIDTLKKIEWFN
jgi:virulence-associated protein VapD